MSLQSSIECEYQNITEKNGWFNEYTHIREVSEIYAKNNNFVCEESKKPQNRKYNRYRDVNPFDYSRIVLKRPIGTDYINANLVKMERAKRQYILCQGPLEITVGHFWLMVWEQQSAAILMLNKVIEKKQVKCHKYWPDKLGDKMILNDVGLSIEYTSCEDYKNFSKRIFIVTDIESSKSRDVIQFHYTTWPDFGVPSSPIAFLQFLKQVRDSGVLDEDVGPPVIHCSAGIGRSGTFCLVDCCLVLIDKEGENPVSVQDVLLELRKYRMGLIQTHDQLKFSYEAIIEGMKRINNDTFNELDNLEIATNNDENYNDEIVSPPPVPPRTLSLSNKVGLPNTDNGNGDIEERNNVVNNEKTHHSIHNRPLPPAPTSPLEIVDESNSDQDTSDVEDELESDSSKDSDSEISDEDDEELGKKPITSDGFDANASLPPIPNGTFDINSEKQMSSSEGEMSPKSNTSNQEIRHRIRTERNTVMQEKIREIKRKQKEVEDKKLSSPKKRRSIFLSIVAGVLISAYCAYIYLKA